MQRITHKIILGLVGMALIAGPVFVFRPEQTFAQDQTFYVGPFIAGTSTTIPLAPKPSLTIGDLWGSFVQGVIKAGESAGYTIIRKYVRQGLANLTKDVWKQLLTGGKGQSEVFQIEPWDKFWETAGDEAFGSAVEGFAQGFQNEYELTKKKAALVQDLGLTDSVQRQEGAAGLVESGVGSVGPEKRAIQSESVQTSIDIKGAGCHPDPDRVYVLDALGNATGTSQAANEAEKKRCADLNSKQTKLTAGLNQLDRDKKAADEADANLIAGNTGALTDASKTLIDIVCKPSIDISLGIFLGLGDQIELAPKRKALCPYSEVSKNWQNLINNTGTKLTDASLGGWQTIAGLVNPNTSDLGAAYGISISGRSVSDVAKALGVTQFMSEQTQGGLKALTDFSGKTTTPAGVVRSLAENSLKVQIEEDTRFIPTGHLLADLILTAGQTVLSTSLTILTDGLRKKQAVTRNANSRTTGSAFAALTAGGNNVLYNPSANPSFGGQEAAEARLADFSKLELSAPQDWKVLSTLSNTSCPESMEGGARGGQIDACVADDKFIQAIKQRITVAEAIAKNLLDGDSVFGYDIMGNSPKEPSWQGNFPYRSLVILRKYRVLPVSWELAALFIKDSENKTRVFLECANGNCTLNKLIEKFTVSSSVFYGMIDPNWVLMIPPGQCNLKGYGAEIQDIQSTQECVPNASGGCDMKEVKKVVRAPEQCVDYQTCLDETEEGKCNQGRYGYCIQEQKIIRFKGEKCDKKFEGCDSFQDTTTKQTVSYIKASLTDYRTGKCSEDNAGCQWFSATRNIDVVAGPKVSLNNDKQGKSVVSAGIQREWSQVDKVYFATSSDKLQKCQPQAEGCREVSGVSGMSYLRLPPDSLRCGLDGVDANNNTVHWYNRADCKQFTALCKKDYVGCEQYTPVNDTFAVTGKSPDDSAVPVAPNTSTYQYRCPAQCANIISYAEQKTLFDAGAQDVPARTSVYFNVDTARQCAITDSGCEEFTNINKAAQGGEGKEYYTYLQKCENKDPSTLSVNEVFYSFVGADQAGGKPEKVYVKGSGTAGTVGYSPVCSDGTTTTCDCSTEIDRIKYDPRIGTRVCREFINANGTSFYRWTDKLTYYTADCSQYRRTLDGDSATPLLASPSLSKQCSSPAALNCREYHAPTAGNIRVLPDGYSNFEDGTTGNWTAVAGVDKISSTTDGEIVGDHSFMLKNSSTNTSVIKKTVELQEKKSYLVSFSLKGPANGTAETYVKTAAGTPHASPTTQTLSGTWQRLQFEFSANQMVNFSEKNIYIKVFTGSDAKINSFLIDDIVIKETDGIEYVVRDSWSNDSRCFIDSYGYFLTGGSVVPSIPGSYTKCSCDTNEDKNCSGSYTENNYSAVKRFAGGSNDPATCSEYFTQGTESYIQTYTKKKEDVSHARYPGCQLYTDRQGGQHAIQKFERICPLEMAGCQEVGVSSDITGSWNFEDANTGTQGWQPTSQGSTVTRETTTGVVKGSGSLKLSTGRTRKDAMIYNQSHYIVSFDVRGVAGAIVNATLWSGNVVVQQATLPSLGGTANTWEHKEFKLYVDKDVWNYANSYIQIDVSGDSEAYLDNISIQKKAYIIPDPSKQCSAQDNKCTAYGSPKLLTKIDGSQRIKTTENKTAAAGYKQKEDWNIAYYKVTPEEAQLAQSQFASGDTSGYNGGICRNATYSGSTMTDPGDLGCKEYLAGGKGDKTWFRDPGNLVCQSPKEGGTQGFYYVCANNRTVVCRTDGDCPLKSDGNSGTCDTEKEVIANCPTLPQTVATPSFAQMCPAQANGCRLIEDPECTAGTSDPDKGTLRNDYGRGSTGVPCTRNYYFTGNLDDQSQECNGKINVEKGCLLFNDANQQKFEYRIVNNPPSIDPATLSGSVPYCQCDTNISEYSDCRDAEIAAASDPDVCYNRYTQDVAATGALLRKYEKIRLDLTYNSVKYYTQAKASANTGGSVDKGYAAGSRFYYSMNNTITPYSTLQDVTAGTLVSRPDANSLIKVKQDRQCKLWLKCTGYYNDGAREICFKRDLCNKWGKGNTCASIITDIPTDNPAVSGYIVGGGNGQVTTGQEAVRSLSGIARPDYMFPNYNPTPPTDSLQGPEGNYWPTGAGDYFWKTANGRNSNFSLWKQPTLAGISDRTYSKLESNPQYSAPYYSRALNSCRLYPEQYSPLSTPGNLVDACRVKSGSYGVYGFCLEPYPNYQLNYFPFRMVCTNNTDQTCEVDGDCGAGNKCAYRYYENACLTWFPVDRIDGQQNLFTSASGQEVTAFDQKGPVYVCVHKDALPADELINSSDVVVGSPGSFSDSLNNVAVGHPGTAYFTDGVISPSNPKALNLPLSEVGGVNYSGFSTNGKFGGPVKSGNYGDAYYFWKSGVEFDKHSGSCTPCELAAGGKDHSFGRVGSLQSECNNLKLNNFLEQDSATGDYLYDTPLMACYDFQSSCRKGGLGYNYVYGKIEPAYDPGTGKFKGWRHITCDTEKDDSTITINASLDIKPYTAKQTDKARYNGEYCSEFVKVVDENSNSVPVVGSLSGTSMSDFIKKTISSAEVTRVLTTTDPKAKKIILNGKQETCSYKTYADYDPTNNSTSCNWIPGSNILDAAVAPGGISPIKVFKIEDYVTTGDKDNIKFYFAKPYQYYLQDSTSSKYFEGYYYTADQDNLTKNWWDYARDSVAQSDSNRPRIYGKNKTEVNQFAYETFNGTGIAIRFYSDVNNAQMPIKKIKIDWDGGETTNVFNGTFEGRGLNETFGVAPDSGSEPKNSFHGHGPFYFDYGAPFDGKKVCVEVKDNWDAITTTCGTFSGSGNTGTVTFEVPNATDIP